MWLANNIDAYAVITVWWAVKVSHDTLGKLTLYMINSNNLTKDITHH